MKGPRGDRKNNVNERKKAHLNISPILMGEHEMTLRTKERTTPLNPSGQTQRGSSLGHPQTDIQESWKQHFSYWTYLVAGDLHRVRKNGKKCPINAIHWPEQKEPLMPSPFPKRPKYKLGSLWTSLISKKNLCCGYWLEMGGTLNNLSSLNTNANIKSIFAVHRILDFTVSDNGPQFASTEFKKFATYFWFTHTTCSPKHPENNGEAKGAVKTVKQVLKTPKIHR